VELFIEELVTVGAEDNGNGGREICCFCGKICCSDR
jgi:hypothetical protein